MKTRIAPTLKSRLLVLVCVFGLVTSVTFAQANNITVQVDKPGAPVPKTFFGLFFEDINFGADGGLYPERVKNRSFEFPNPMMGWTAVDRSEPKGQLYVFDRGSIQDTANSHYVRIKAPAGNKGSGMMNEGLHRQQFRPTMHAEQLLHVVVWCSIRAKVVEPDHVWRPLPCLNMSGSNKNGQRDVYATASLDEPAGEVILKVVNTGPAAKSITINIAGPKKVGKTGKTYVLERSDLKAENSLDNPTRVAPVERSVRVSGNEFPFTLTPQSLTVIRLALR